jgi:hypothetical protein
LRLANEGPPPDAFCLVRQNGRWEVFYTERGCDSPPIYTGESEEGACEFFYNYIRTREHWHMVGFFRRESDAEEMEARVRVLGAKPIRNDIPAYKRPGDSRYRVFVIGKDIFSVRKGIPGVPVKT